MSDVKLTFDNVTIEGVNIKHLNKGHSTLGSNYNNAAKKELKDITKDLNCLDTAIEKLRAAPGSKKKYNLIDYRKASEDFEKLSKLAGLDSDDWNLEYNLRAAMKHYKGEPLTKDEIILACNKKIKALEKELVECQTQLEKKLSDDKWLLHLTFSKYCYIDVKGPAAKKVYEILSDKEDHDFVFTLDDGDIKDADSTYHLTLTAIDAEEI